MMGLKSMCVEKYRKVLPASHGITQQPASQGSGSHRTLLLRVLPNGLEVLLLSQGFRKSNVG